MKIKHNIVIITLLILTFLSIIPSQKVYAHDAYFLRVLVNEGTMLYEGRVEFDDESFFSNEIKHAEHELGNFQSMKDGAAANTNEVSTKYITPADSGKSMIFTFPARELGAKFVGRDDKNHATDADRARAVEISNVLIPSLNGILVAINNGKSYVGQPAAFAEATNKIIKASNGTTTTHQGFTLTPNPTKGIITVSKGTQSQSFPYRMLKGYNNATIEGGVKSLIYDSRLSDDAKYINIGMLASQGYYAMKVKSTTLSNLTEVRKPGILERNLTELVVSITGGLETILGLYSIDELVFNRGSRMEYGSHEGVMKKGWMELATSFFMIFQIIAWSVIGVALLKALIEKNLSTMSIVKQISLMTNIQNILIAGFLMTIFFLVLQTFITMNSKLVGIFSSIAPQFSHINATNGGTLADAMMTVFYFFIGIYLNFTYIMRAITIAVLIASAPLFIVSIAFSSRGSELFSKWAKELIANLFLQTFHAFVMGMLLMVQLGSSGIEMAVIALAVIPLTKLFKSLILGEAGGLSGEVASMASGIGVGLATSGAGRGKGKGADGKGSYKGGQDTGDIPGIEDNKARKEHSVETPDIKTTEKTQSVAGKDYAEMTGAAGSGAKSERFETKAKEGKMSEGDMAKTVGKGAVRALKTGGKLAGGAAIGIGAAAMASVGANQASGKLMDAGKGLIGGGAGDLLDDGKSLYGVASNSAKEKINEYRDRNEGPDPGTVVGMETLANGDNVIHRKLQAMQAMGIDDAFASGEELGITYNHENMSEEMTNTVNEWKSMNEGDRKKLGVDGIVTNDNGTSTIFYNNYGKKQLGMKDAYRVNNRIVETKNHRHGATRYLYKPSDVSPQGESDKTDKTGNDYSKKAKQ